MRTATVSTLALLAASSRTASASACVELQGIVPGGGEGALDLSFLLQPESLGNPLAPLDIFTNPFVPIVSEAERAIIVFNNVRPLLITVRPH